MDRYSYASKNKVRLLLCWSFMYSSMKPYRVYSSLVCASVLACHFSKIPSSCIFLIFSRDDLFFSMIVNYLALRIWFAFSLPK